MTVWLPMGIYFWLTLDDDTPELFIRPSLTGAGAQKLAGITEHYVEWFVGKSPLTENGFMSAGISDKAA